MFNTSEYRVTQGAKIDLRKVPTHYKGNLKKDAGKAELERMLKRLQELQEVMYAECKNSLLVVLQAMDTGGKDSVIRHIFGPLNSAGVNVTSFKAPSTLERGHDYLWRVHAHTPNVGFISVFNRSHYEDVLIARVRNLVPAARWKKRYRHINEFERLLADEGTTIVKLFLHISKEYQREQLQERLDEPAKRWKFNVGDLSERAHWNEYQEAYGAALSQCSPRHASWYIVPGETKWFRDLLIARVLVDTLERLDMRYPKPAFDRKTITID